ncbi:MAG: hypothetical protein RRB22_06780 [Gammaproteobacteria bacterium]|nr:hypothetical protein [Gammaproteobacteria bacterium]
MHAVIKIICFLIFAAAMAAGESAVLLLGTLLVVPLYLFKISTGGCAPLGPARVMLKRLRWLFLSIFVIYLFFTPGVLLWPELVWGPTREGVLLGLSRIAVLVLLVAAVNVLLTSTGQDEFLGAIHWCLRPLSWIGVSHERLAVRISLTLESVSAVRAAYRRESRVGDEGATAAVEVSATGPRLRMIARTAQRLFSQVVREAHAAPLREIALPEQTRPPLLQWGIPLLLLAVIVGVKLTAKSLAVEGV